MENRSVTMGRSRANRALAWDWETGGMGLPDSQISSTVSRLEKAEANSGVEWMEEKSGSLSSLRAWKKPSGTWGPSNVRFPTFNFWMVGILEDLFVF